MALQIYHNPRCSKSRATLKILTDRGHAPAVIEYLKTPPDVRTLRQLLIKLNAEPIEIMRTGEEAFRDEQATVLKMPADDQIAWLADHPQVLQRPIVVNGDRAAIGRPPENVLALLGS